MCTEVTQSYKINMPCRSQICSTDTIKSTQIQVNSFIFHSYQLWVCLLTNDAPWFSGSNSPTFTVPFPLLKCAVIDEIKIVKLFRILFMFKIKKNKKGLKFKTLQQVVHLQFVDNPLYILSHRPQNVVSDNLRKTQHQTLLLILVHLYYPQC